MNRYDSNDVSSVKLLIPTCKLRYIVEWSMGEVFALWERGRISSEQFKEALQSQRLSLEILEILKSGAWKFENLHQVDQQQGLLRSHSILILKFLKCSICSHLFSVHIVFFYHYNRF